MNFKIFSTLEIVEEFASNNDLIDSEEKLSERFDAEIAHSVIEQYGKNDIAALNEAFNNWTDGLCKDGEIHQEQYEHYTYVGKYSEEY